MKTRSLSLVLCLSAAIAVALGGCRKKPEATTNDAPAGEPSASISDLGQQAMKAASDTTSKAVEAAGEMKDKAVAKVMDIAQQFQADQNSTIPEITARAKEMAVENLRKMAEKYRDALAANQQKLKDLTEKFIAVPDAEKDTAPVENLKATIDLIYQGLGPLKERFQVYYNALKEKTGDLTGLDI